MASTGWGPPWTGEATGTLSSARTPSSSSLTSVSRSSPATWSTSFGSRPMAKGGKGGVARSMSTSGVVDRVTESSVWRGDYRHQLRPREGEGRGVGGPGMAADPRRKGAQC